MTLVLAGAALSLAVLPFAGVTAFLSLGWVFGWLFGGPVTALAGSIFSACLPLSLERIRRNRRNRCMEKASIRALEAMVEASWVTTGWTDILAAGGRPVRDMIFGPAGGPAWLRRSLKQIFAQSRREGAALNRPLNILLDEARLRAELGGTWRSQNAALLAVAVGFLLVEVALVATVVMDPATLHLFRTGAGRDLSAWILISTAAALTTPWLQSEAFLW